MLDILRKKQAALLFDSYKKDCAALEICKDYLFYHKTYLPHMDMRCSRVKGSFLSNKKRLVELFFKEFGVRLILCKPGTFQTGSWDWNNLEDASIKKPFFLAEIVVTQKLYSDVMGLENPSKNKGDEQNPVENITWIEAAKFCNSLSRMFGFPPYYDASASYVEIFESTGFRMPTPVEWEYAAKAGTQNRWSGTDTLANLSDYVWFPTPKTTKPVAQKKPNTWGFYDMGGNVREMCSSMPPEKDKPRNRYRMAKGGCYESYSDDGFYIANSVELSTNQKVPTIGFRIAKSFY